MSSWPRKRRPPCDEAPHRPHRNCRAGAASGLVWDPMRTHGPVAPLVAALRLEVEHTVSNSGDEVHIWICGELDIATHGELQAGLSDVPVEDASVVRLNLSGLTFCDA